MATNPPTHPCHICGGKLEWEVVPQHREPWEAPRFGPTDWRQLPHECPPRAVEAWVERVFDKSPRQPFFKEIEAVSERKEVMWCTVCGGRFTEDEVKEAGGIVIDHLSTRLRQAEAQRDRMKATLEALRDDPAVPAWIQTLATGTLVDR